jgi:hypothetical protein
MHIKRAMPRPKGLSVKQENLSPLRFLLPGDKNGFQKQQKASN